jgi:hypothetical protein
MELVIAGLITGLGYVMSRRPSRVLPPPTTNSRVLAVNRPESYPFSDASELQRKKDHASEQRWLASRDPNSNIIDHRMAPFFTSMRSQNTNDDVKQRRMELFSGHLNEKSSATGTWKPKQESGPRFDPVPQPVTSGGSAGNAVNYDAQRKQAMVSGIQTGIRPFEQKIVGPGLGINSDVPAVDGFHSMYRVKPVDGYAHKINQLESRVVAGGATVPLRQPDPSHYSKGVPRFYALERRPPEKSRAATTAQAQRPQVQRVGGCRVDGQEYYGGAGLSGQNLAGASWARHKEDNNMGLPTTNLTGEGRAPGAFTTASFDTAKFESQQREASTLGYKNIKGDIFAPQAPKGYIVPPTQRDLSRCQGAGYGGIAGHIVPSTTSQPVTGPQPTIRDKTQGLSNGPGAAAPILTAATLQCTGKQLLKEAKRGSQVVSTYVAMADRPEEYRRARYGDVRRCIPLVAVKRDLNAARIASHAQASVMYENQAYPGQSSTAQRARLPEINMRQDYTLAKTNLRGNDLAISIN